MSKTRRLVVAAAACFLFAQGGQGAAESGEDWKNDPVVTAKGLPPAKGKSYQWQFMALAGAIVVFAGVGLLVLIKSSKNVSKIED